MLLLPLLGIFGAKQMVEDGITTEDAAYAAWKREHAANVDHFQWLELPEYDLAYMRALLIFASCRVVSIAVIAVSLIAEHVTHKHATTQTRKHVTNPLLILVRYAAGKAVAFSYGSPVPSTKLAVFDFDGTLINPLVRRNGRRSSPSKVCAQGMV